MGLGTLRWGLSLKLLRVGRHGGGVGSALCRVHAVWVHACLGVSVISHIRMFEKKKPLLFIFIIIRSPDSLLGGTFGGSRLGFMERYVGLHGGFQWVAGRLPMFVWITCALARRVARGQGFIVVTGRW